VGEPLPLSLSQFAGREDFLSAKHERPLLSFENIASSDLVYSLLSSASFPSSTARFLYLLETIERVQHEISEQSGTLLTSEQLLELQSNLFCQLETLIIAPLSFEIPEADPPFESVLLQYIERFQPSLEDFFANFAEN